MKFKLFFITVALGLTSMSANAAWLNSSDVTSPVTLTNGGQSISFSFNPAVVDKLWWSNDANPGDFPNQNASTIADEINEVFGANTVNFATDFVGEGTLSSGSSDIISLNSTFNFLAIHLGTNELFFKFLSPISEFSIFDVKGSKGNGAGLSNFRAFNTTPPNPVPVPAAVWLFGSALTGLGLTKRKTVKA